MLYWYRLFYYERLFVLIIGNLFGIISPCWAKTKTAHAGGKMFNLKQHGTTVRTELGAGVTTFMAMAYILMVNAGMFATLGDGYYNAVYIATAISAVFGTVLIGLLSNLPLAQASGMGLNAFFVYSVCIGMNFTYANALVMVLVDGIVFLILTVTGLRSIIFNAIPKAVKSAIAPGIGLFIAFLGMQNCGIVVNSDSTLVDLHSFNVFFGHTTWAEIMPLLITIFAIIAIAAMSQRKVRGAVFYGILGAAVVYYVLGLITVEDFYATTLQGSLSFNIIQPFRDFFDLAFCKVFTEGFDFSAFIAANGAGSFIATFISTMLAFCMIDMFDTLGTLYGACSVGNLLDKDGNVPNMNRAMFADAAATCFGAICGTSTVTTFVESSAGIAEGGRTGLTSIFAAAMFFIAMFFAPIAALVPSCATAASLIYVGILMIGGVKDVDWSDPTAALPAFMTMACMPFTYNISYGIAFGLTTYIFVKILTGKVKDINVGTWIIGALFAAMFFVAR
jgi:adenine/guanine/hypoxanthine permease